MFTGIVSDIGRIRALRDTRRDRRFEVETTYDLATIDIGASISHAGCCLTVVEKGDGWFAVEVSTESLDASTLASLTEGSTVNLEPRRGSATNSAAISCPAMSTASGR